MPPFLPRKRSPPPVSQAIPVKRARLADALDAEATNNVPSLKQVATFSLGSEDSTSESSLSDIDSDQFEDVPVQDKRPKAPESIEDEEEDEEGDDDGDIVWEDAAATQVTGGSDAHIPIATGPIQIILRKDEDGLIDYSTAAKAGSGKKGPSKREKQVRVMTHQLHVQFLLWHNAIRNSWIGDQEVQNILVKQLPPQISKEVDKWRRSSGLVVPSSTGAALPGERKRRKRKEELGRNQRDWGRPSERLEVGKPDLSHGDPLITLVKVLSAYWKKKFAITAPGLRKRGYGTKHGLKQDITSLRNDEHDPERHGERVENLAEFRKIARKGEGSRDIGAQLFTALLRGLGIEARLVASLQPSGYGWTKVEQMLPRKTATLRIDDVSLDSDVASLPNAAAKASSKKSKSTKPSRPGKLKSKTISLDTDGDDDDDDSGEDENGLDIKDDESIIDVTPTMPKPRKPKYDRDLVFPIYWTEAVSPITNKVLPVSPLVLEIPVASTPEALSLFEPKGAKAEKGRQVMAYVVAYSSDGTAKDVTVRYLRKHIWPGKTKGFRIPTERMPIYDKRGKVKRYEDYDWFKHVLRPYTRSDHNRTPVDDLEESVDLVPQQLEKKNDDEAVDTLQSLKSSADFVLERFLRREEALRPDAEPVRIFISGKGDKYREEPVYRRADVERCLTAESWHKEGRRPNLGETPMKMVPVRAVTLTRKREAEEHERQYGEKQTQGLYSWDQTEWIIPAPIKDGVIPKNAYGNMDCFVPSMVPRGAVHIPLKGTVRICKKLEIDFAEAVTGFEFGNKRAVPVCTGVVVAAENERMVKDAWTVYNEEQRRKEESKMEKLVLDLWRKFVLGLRIRERVQYMYGEEIGVVQDVPTGFTMEEAIAIDDEDEQGGEGFVNEEEDEEMGGGFLLPHEEEAAPMEDLIMDDHHRQAPLLKEPDVQYPGPSSLSSEGLDSHQRSNPAASISNGDSELSEDNSEIENNNIRSSKAVPQTKASQSQRSRFTALASYRAEDSNDKIQEGEPAILKSNDRKVPNVATGNGSDEDEDDAGSDKEEEHEVYTPRSTRTRTANQPTSTKLNSTSKQTMKSKPGVTSKKTPEAKRKTTPRSKKGRPSGGAEVNASNESPLPSTSVRRGRGRPCKDEMVAKTKMSTPKRSTTLSRRESTMITSPYFDQ